MAIYQTDQGEIDAVQYHDDMPLANGDVAKAGDWCVTMNGEKKLCVASEFVNVKQKYPRPVDEDRADAIRVEPSNRRA